MQQSQETHAVKMQGAKQKQVLQGAKALHDMRLKEIQVKSQVNSSKQAQKGEQNAVSK